VETGRQATHRGTVFQEGLVYGPLGSLPVAFLELEINRFTVNCEVTPVLLAPGRSSILSSGTFNLAFCLLIPGLMLLLRDSCMFSMMVVMLINGVTPPFGLVNTSFISGDARSLSFMVDELDSLLSVASTKAVL